LRRLIAIAAAIGVTGKRKRGEMKSRSQVEADDTSTRGDAEEAEWRATLGEILAAAEGARAGRAEAKGSDALIFPRQPEGAEITTDSTWADQDRTHGS
jgi:hypothetical protein